MKLIVGGGLAGLIAAHAWPQASILEAAAEPMESHRALLRFRSDAVSKLTGIEFRKVRVHKGIWFDGKFIEPSILAANLYAQKVLGGSRLTGDRSIWNIAPVDRYIAPDSFYEQLIDSVGRRIEWNTSADFGALKDFYSECVSTAPMPTVLRQFHDYPIPTPSFRRSGIRVKRWRLPHADVFQTVYFPAHDIPLYRASITGGLLIAEFAAAHKYDGVEIASAVAEQQIERAFGIDLGAATPLDEVSQKFGKIEPIPDEWRKKILFWLTHQHKIYSLGRFATWRNILLDDVVEDIAVIKRLSRNYTPYDASKA